MAEQSPRITRADQVQDVSVRMGMARIFGEGFAQWLGYFAKDSEKIARSYVHSFVLDQFYVALINREVAGMAACTGCKSLSMRLDRRELRRHFGWYRGTIAGIALKKNSKPRFGISRQTPVPLNLWEPPPVFAGKGSPPNCFAM